MLVGTARIDVTPDYVTDLCGYAQREQPRIGVLHPIYVRAAVFECDGRRMAVVSCEVLELPRQMADDMRRQAAQAIDTSLSTCASVVRTRTMPRRHTRLMSVAAFRHNFSST